MAPCMAISLTVGISFLVKTFGEVRVVKASMCVNVFLTVCLVSATHYWQILVAYGVLMGPGMMFMPLTSGIKSNLVRSEDAGKVQGLLSAVKTFASSIADIVFGYLYRSTT